MISFQILATLLIMHYLGASIVLARPRITKKTNEGDMRKRLRDNYLASNVHRFKRLLRVPSSGGLHVMLDKETKGRHLERIKRDLFSTNPCYKHGSYKTRQLSNNVLTYSIECKSSTNTGCFSSIIQYTTAKCTETKVVYPSIGEALVQDCKCAS